MSAIGVTPEVHALAQDSYLADAAGRAALRRCDVLLALTDDELSRLTPATGFRGRRRYHLRPGGHSPGRRRADRRFVG